MVRNLFLLVVLLSITSIGASEVQYRGEVDRKSIEMNATIELECDSPCPVSSWNLVWNLPEDARIEGIEDSLGEINDYSRSGESVTINTNTGEPRRRETVKIRMVIDRKAENIQDNLDYRKFSIPSLPGRRTTGVFRVEDLISGWIGYGFATSFDGEEFRFSGKGPTNFRVNFGSGEKTEYYEFLGEGQKRVESSGDAYRLAVGTTGIVQDFERFPVAVMNDSRFDEVVAPWSAGEYTAGTLTLRRESEKNPLPLLTHETVHGLNDRFLRWDRTGSSYFDEGVAEYAEYLMKKRLFNQGRINTGAAEVFGDEREYRVEEDDGSYIYTVPSHGNRERLWNYYREGGDLMKRWNPREFQDSRSFGYAYSQLIFMNHVANNGSVKDLYSSISPDRKVASTEEKWNLLSKHLDLTPCRHESREKFDRCLDSINDYDYPYYSGVPDRQNKSLTVEEIKVPERNFSSGKNNFSDSDLEEYSFLDFLKGFLDYLASFFR